MSLFSRIRTQVVADTHGVVDALEDKRLLLKQHLRDAEAELLRKQSELDGIDAELRDLARLSEALNKRLEGFDASIELAIREGQDDLARHALKRQLTTRAELQRASQRKDVLSERQQSLTETLAEQRERFDELRSRVASQLERCADDPLREDLVTKEDVELELLRRKAERAGGE